MLDVSAAAQVRRPRALEQFIIDCATNDFPIGHFVFTTISTKKQGIDAQAINAYLEHHGLNQRVKMFFTDNAGEPKVMTWRSSSRSSTSSSFHPLLAVSIRTPSPSMLAGGAWVTRFATILSCTDVTSRQHQ